MKIIEIEHKYFFCRAEAVALLEAYTNPATELDIKFRHRASEHSDEFYEAEVFESASNQLLLLINFVLRKKSNAIEIGNIEPILSGDKLVHTSIGIQNNGVDMGSSAMRWLLRKLKEFALSKGFKIKHIATSTRYTGARAKNNPGADLDTGLAKNFSTTKTISEALWYNCANDTFEVKGNK